MMRAPRTPEPPPLSVLPTRPMLDALRFWAWIGQAAPGDWLEYHRGFLVVDTDEKDSSLPGPDRLRLRSMADATHLAFEMRLVHLVQLRLGPNQFAYLAIARPRKRKAEAALASLLREAA